MNCVRCTSLVVRLPFTTARHLPCLWKLWHRSCRNEWGLPTYQLTQLREWHRILFSIIFFFSWNKTNFLYRIFTFWFLYICLKQYFFFLGGVLGKRCYWEIFYVKESDWIFFFFSFTNFRHFYGMKNERKSCHLTEFMCRSWSYQLVVECQFRFLGSGNIYHRDWVKKKKGIPNSSHLHVWKRLCTQPNFVCVYIWSRLLSLRFPCLWWNAGLGCHQTSTNAVAATAPADDHWSSFPRPLFG